MNDIQGGRKLRREENMKAGGKDGWWEGEKENE